jgi:hypothetical protein
MKGIQVPRILLNISKLFSIMRAIMKKSIKITKETKITAVCNGLV